MVNKKIIIDAIQKKKEKEIKVFDDKINDVLKINDIAKLYRLITKTFQNTMKQGNISIKFLKNNLDNDFFKKASTGNNVNYISFSNENFSISFSKSLGKEITIRFKNCGQRKYYNSCVGKSEAQLADSLEEYLNDKSFKSLKEVTNFYWNKTSTNFINKMISSVLKYIITYKKCDVTMLDKIRKAQEKDKIHEEIVRENNKQFEEKQIYAKQFVDSLTCLQSFRDNGWHFKYYGIEDEAGTITT